MNLMKNKTGISVLLLPATFVFAFCAFVLTAGTAHAATIYFSPSSGNFAVDNILNASVLVNTQGTAINNADAVINFPTALLEVISVNKSGSIFPLWVEEPSFSNSAGTISFNGGAPTPGFSGTAGELITITFRVRNPGSASLVFSSATVRANDGYGTDVLQTRGQAQFNLVAKQQPAQLAPSSGTAENNDLLAHITSSTHPDQTKWYSLSHVVLDWTNAQSVSAVHLGYDTNADGVPGVLYTDPISHKELQLNDGIWYFHVREKGSSGWGPISTFRIQIDTTPPTPVVIKFPNGATTATSTIAIAFATTDELSGIDHYELAVDGHSTVVSSQEGSGVYALPAGDNGTHMLTVTAYDKAQNSVSAEQQFTTARVVVESAPAWGSFAWLIANYLSLFLLFLVALAALIFVGWYLWHRFHNFRRRVVNKEERMHVLIHRQFNELKNAIADEVTALEHIKSKRELTVEEERLINHLKKLIDESENTIERELESVLKK